jgi:hypothetical protein
VFASGTVTDSDGASTLHLRRHRILKAGYYTLTLTSGHGWSAHVVHLPVKIA